MKSVKLEKLCEAFLSNYVKFYRALKSEQRARGRPPCAPSRSIVRAFDLFKKFIVHHTQANISNIFVVVKETDSTTESGGTENTTKSNVASTVHVKPDEVSSSVEITSEDVDVEPGKAFSMEDEINKEQGVNYHDIEKYREFDDLEAEIKRRKMAEQSKKQIFIDLTE